MTDEERRKRFDQARQCVLRDSVAVQRDTAALLRKRLDEANDRIAAILAGAPSDFRLWQLTELQRQVRAELATFEVDAASAVNAGLDRSHAVGQALVDAPLAAGGVDIAADVVKLDVRKLEATRVFALDRIKDISAEAIEKIGSEIALAATGAISPDEAAAKVASTLKDGGMKRARTIVRTELGTAFSEASQDRQAQAKAVLPGMQKQWRRSGKLYSRFDHDAIDGQIKEVDEPFELPDGTKLMYPRDPAAPAKHRINCGCSSIPFMASWAVARPGRQEVTKDERDRSRGKRIISDAFE